MKYYITDNNSQVFGNLLKDLSQLNQYKNWIVTIKEGKESKTSQQRSYFHALLDIISKHTGDSIDDLKTRACWALGFVRDVKLKNGETIKERESTEKLTKEQYSQLIDAAKTMCQFLELQYPDPNYFGMDVK